MIPYVIVFIIITFGLTYAAPRYNSCGLSRQYAGILTIIVGCVYILFSSMKDFDAYYFMNDMSAYEMYFNQAGCSLGTYFRTSIFEPGYVVFSWAFYRLFGNYRLFLIVLYLLIFACFVYFIKNIEWRKNRFLTLAAIIILLFSSMYLLRMGIAIGFGLVMIIKLSQGKKNVALFFLLIGISFHYSAMILLPAYVFTFVFGGKVKIGKWVTIFLVLITFGFTYIASSCLVTYMAGSSKYYVYKNTGSIGIPGVVVLLFILILSFYKYSEIIGKPKCQVHAIITISLFANALVIPLQLQYGIMYRMNLFFLPMQYVALEYLRNTYSKTVMKYVIGIVSVVYFVYRIYALFSVEIEYLGLPYKLIF
jgi:transmembrane protein EpsG